MVLLGKNLFITPKNTNFLPFFYFLHYNKILLFIPYIFLRYST